MKKSFKLIFLATLIIGLGLTTLAFSPAPDWSIPNQADFQPPQAQITLTPSPGLLPESNLTGTFSITFEELGYDQQILPGPNSQTNYYFSLPAHWQPETGSYLELNLDYLQLNQQQDIPIALLTVQLNNILLQTTSFTNTTAQLLRVETPVEAWQASTTGVNELKLDLTVYDDNCENAELSSLTIYPSSTLHLNYTELPLTLDLADYPKPIYQPRSFKPNQLRFILPPQPGQADLRAATMIAAGLGQLTSNRVVITSGLVSNLSPTTLFTEDLMIIGNPNHNPLVGQLPLPVALVERQLTLWSELPAVVIPGQTFSYTLAVKNNSPTAVTVALEDRWSPGLSLQSCNDCQEISPGVWRWQLGSLAAQQEISTVVQMRLDTPLELAEPIEHTASLLDQNDQVINVDTLSSRVGVVSEAGWVSSKKEKGPYFFALNGQGVAEQDGLIQEIASPWLPGQTIIVVTGLSDEALDKAGQALAATTRLPGMAGSYALIQSTQPISTSSTPPTEQFTLADLGYTDNVINVSNEGGLQYTFYVPRGWVLSEGAKLQLHLAHSVALNAISATVEVALNRIPISSIKLDEQNETDTWHTIPLPPSRLTVGLNRLTVQVKGNLPACLDRKSAEKFWLSVYADSFFSLPHQITTSTFDLADFPQPFSNQINLQDLVFLLPQSPGPVEIQGLLQLSALLGSASQGDYFLPQVRLGGDPTKADLPAGHLIVIGRPTQNPYIAAVNDLLPQPFIAGADQIRQQIEKIIYRLAPGYSLGYIQALISPWHKDYIMLIITGTTDEGLSWAFDALNQAEFSPQLAGNLVSIIQSGDLRATDTRKIFQEVTAVSPSVVLAGLTPEATVTPTPTPTPSPLPPSPTPTGIISTPVDSPDSVLTVIQTRPPWLIALMVLSLVTLIIAIGIGIWQTRS